MSRYSGTRKKHLLTSSVDFIHFLQSLASAFHKITYVSVEIRYRDNVYNTVEENSSAFSLIRMRCLPPARARGQ